jgi:ribulose bisphosphate carboxylase small subunit
VSTLSWTPVYKTKIIKSINKLIRISHKQYILQKGHKKTIHTTHSQCENTHWPVWGEQQKGKKDCKTPMYLKMAPSG